MIQSRDLEPLAQIPLQLKMIDGLHPFRYADTSKQEKKEW
jgi:hypothetical protein